jgi:steroid 5-alpha reductase family enzyme
MLITGVLGRTVGELLFWWGIFVLCSTAIIHQRWAYFTIISPLFITFILFGVSGLPLLERSANE